MPRLGPLSDPAVRHQRAKIARASQSTPSYHIRKLAESLPAFTDEEAEAFGRLAAELDQRRTGPRE